MNDVMRYTFEIRILNGIDRKVLTFPENDISSFMHRVFPSIYFSVSETKLLEFKYICFASRSCIFKLIFSIFELMLSTSPNPFEVCYITLIKTS